MNSKITITFNQAVIAGNILQIQDANTPNTLIDIQFGTTVGSILPSGNINVDILDTQTFINGGYNSTNRYNVTADYTLNTVTVEDRIGGVSTFSVVSNNTAGKLTTVLANQPVQPQFKINTVTLLESATDKCNLVSLVVATTEQATNITSPVSASVTTNPFTITGVSRDSVNDITVTVNNSTQTDTRALFVPKIESSLFDLQIIKAPSSSSLNIIWKGARPPYFNLTYSLNNVTFYSSTSFSGLAVGSHTLYIKDSIGCSISIPFIITAFQPNVFVREADFKITEQNSLIYVKRESTNNCSIFKNQTNTLSYEEDTQANNQSFKQLFQKCDGVRKEQLRTNYTTVTSKLVNCDGVEVNLPLTKKTTNLNITDVRDVKISSVSYLNSSFVGVSYVSGKTYNPLTLVESGSYYLGSDVPAFMNAGDYVSIAGAGWQLVKDVVYINNIQYLILNILTASFPIPVTGQTLKGTSVYNQLPYEVYEFQFDFNTLSGDYHVVISGTDTEFTAVKYMTEWFNVKKEQDNTYVLDYYNSVNNETNYSTGIRNRIRVPYSISLTQSPNDTQEVYLTDTSAVMTEADYREFYTLEVLPLPLNFTRKIGLAVSNDRLFLNGLSLLKNKELEQERVGLSNLYKLTIQFVRSDYVFSNISDDGSIVITEGEVLGANDITQEALGTKDN